ncbi:MAG: hypothetical protein AAB336_14245, partial [Acidobacteriota bacterium]
MDFLDSIDEAKLAAPSDFQHAIRKLHTKLKDALERITIVLSGRTTMFRPVSDLAFCTEKLCHQSKEIKDFPEIGSAQPSEGDDSENEFENCAKESLPIEVESNGIANFKVFRLTDLSLEQIREYVRVSKLENSDGFVDDLRNNDFLEFARRPQDLIDLAAYWKTYGKLNSRVEVMDFNISTKLKERDENRATAPSVSRLLEGAQLMAAASVICKKQNIQIEDSGLSEGLKPSDLLIVWSPTDIRTLFSRPIFDEALYGTVRFHHRTVKEYLCAKWYRSLLDLGVSKRLVVAEFFKKQFDVTVVPPSRRPILPWLLLLDDDIRDMAIKFAPEVFLEGGDPTKIPIHIKRVILTKICDSFFEKNGHHVNFDSDAMKRFAVTELSEIIHRFLANENSGPELKRILLRLVEYGKLDGFTEICTKMATDISRDDYQRIISVRIINNSVDSKAKQQLRRKILENGRALERSLISELIDGLDDSRENLVWLAKILQKAELVNEHQIDMLDRSVAEYGKKLSPQNKFVFLQLLNKLMSYPPARKHSHIQLSERHKWLLPAFGEIILPAIEEFERDILDENILSGVNKIGMQGNHDHYWREGLVNSLKQGVKNWRELNNALYWNAVAEIRKLKKDKEPADIYAEMPIIFGCYSEFSNDDFLEVIEFIAQKKFAEDKRLALELAHLLYCRRGEMPADRKLIESKLEGDNELSVLFSTWLAKREENKKEPTRDWAKEREDKIKQSEAEKAKNQAKWSNWYKSNIQTIRDNGKKAEITNALITLFDRTRKSEFGGAKWASTNWQRLISSESREVAEAYRDALIDFWKNADPELKSQKSNPNQTGYEVILGLSGIGIEAKHDPKWIEKLTPEQAIKALRF